MRGTPGQPVGVRVAGLSVINLGQVPSSGSTTFDATSIVQDLLGPVAPLCQLTVQAIEPLVESVAPAVAPVTGAVESAVGALGGGQLAPQEPAPAAPAPAPVAQQPQAATAPAPALVAPVYGPTMPRFFPFALGRYRSGLPMYNYAELLVGRPGALGRLSAGMLNTDLFGNTSATGNLAAGAQDPAANDVAAAGRASALPADGADRVALPVLVAVLMLAGVTAALIRSWVLVTRR